MCLLLADAGDYCEEFDAQEYFNRVKLLPNQTHRVELQIMEHYKEHVYVLSLTTVFLFLFHYIVKFVAFLVKL